MNIIKLPCGDAVDLNSLNRHDLEQYVCYQMDIEEQCSAALDCLGMSLDIPLIPRAARHDAVTKSIIPTENTNQLPTQYDPAEWQGNVLDAGVSCFPEVKKMTDAQIKKNIVENQVLVNQLLSNIEHLSNLAQNIIAGTQPLTPMY